MLEIGKYYICDPFRGHKKEDGWMYCQIMHRVGTIVQITGHETPGCHTEPVSVGVTLNHSSQTFIYADYERQWHELSEEEVTLYKISGENNGQAED